MSSLSATGKPISEAGSPALAGGAGDRAHLPHPLGAQRELLAGVAAAEVTSANRDRYPLPTLAPRSGYGNALCAEFQQLPCLNLARGGRSSKSYRAECLWQTVLALLNETGAPQQNLTALTDEIARAIEPAALADAYVASREQVVLAQAEEILSLSTQVLPVLHGIALLPLVGQLDSDRAERITLALPTHVSRQHARIRFRDGHWIIGDLGSRNGTFVEGITTHLIELARPVAVRVGRTDLRLEREPHEAQPEVLQLVALGVELRDALEPLGEDENRFVVLEQPPELAGCPP